MKGAGSDEQDVIGADHAVLGGDRRALHQRQKVALHALARDVGAARFLARRDLVDLVEEHDALLLDPVDRDGAQLFLVDALAGFLVGQQLERILDGHFARFLFVTCKTGKHALELLGHIFHARRAHDVHLGSLLRDFDIDLGRIEQPFAQPLAKSLARGVFFAQRRAVRGTGRRDQRVEYAIFGGIFGLGTHALHFLLARQFDRDVGKIANDRVHVAAHIADLGELGRFDLDEGRVRKPCQPARDLGLAHARRADHQNVLGVYFGAQRLGDLLAPPAVAQGHGHRALGARLADDVFVEFGDDFPGGH